MATTITGNIKVLEKNQGQLIDSTITPSTGSGENDIFDNDRSTFWISSGSDDTTDETLTIVFDQAVTFDRILLYGNIKALKMTYGAGATNFANVFSNDGQTLTNLDYNYTSDTLTGYDGYIFEFDSVTSDQINITMKKTNTADQEKKVYELYVGEEIGTFIEDVTSSPNRYDPISSAKNQIELMKSNGGSYSIDRSSKFQAVLELFELWETADQTIYYAMLDQREVTWYPSGGYTTYTQRGWRVNDFYSINVIADEHAKFAHGRDKDLGIIAPLTLKEI